MSLVAALAGSPSIVIASDGYGYQGDVGGFYGFPFSKLSCVNQDRWLLGMAGTDIGKSLADELARENTAFPGNIDKAVYQYARRMQAIYEERNYQGNCFFLLAAFDGQTPCLYEWEVEDGVWQGSRRLNTHRTAIGARLHGALYFSAAYHKPDMNTNERLTLAHLCLSEASNQDPRLDRPIHLGVVTPSAGARILSGEEIAPIEKSALAVASQIGEILRKQSLRISENA